ncbi:MAG: type II secretion system protein N [Gallionella sp.]
MKNRLPLIASFILFIALCVSAAYWTMQIIKPPVRAIAAPPQSAQSAPSLNAAAGLFGGQRSYAVASNYQLTGVVVAAKPAESIAIIGINGKSAQAVKVGREVIPGITVQEVQRSHVLLSERGVVKRVELPKDAKRK